MKTLRKFLNNNFENKQENFIQSIEGIGDILVFETQRQKNQLVLYGLQKIRYIIDSLFSLQQENPVKFEQLALNRDFLERYKTDREKALLSLAFRYEENLIGFYTPINQIVRVYHAAINSQNAEICKFSVYQINWILETLSSKKNNGIFIETLLKKLFEITKTAVQNNDSSAYFAAISWYTGIVFNKVGVKNNFKLTYLSLFDKYFYTIIRYIIAENQTNLFNGLVSSLVDGIFIPRYHSRIWEYGHIILRSDLDLYQRLDDKYNIEKKTKDLAAIEKDIDTYEKLVSWLEKFNGLKNIVEAHISEDQRQQASELENEISEFAVTKYKYNNLLEIIYAIGAFCLFKKRYGYIKYLWEFKQPPDSNASWAGHDITPNKLSEVIRFYLKRDYLENKFDFWEGHHGNRVYFKKYFILLLMRVLRSIPSNEQGEFPKVESIGLPKLNAHDLFDLEHSIDDLLMLSADLKDDTQLLSELGFDTDKIDELFDLKLEPFFKILGDNARLQIEDQHKSHAISQAKVEEFKEEVINGFVANAIMRDIFTSYVTAYKDLSSEFISSENKVDRIGINNGIYDKAAFFDDWYVHFPSLGEQCGASLAICENKKILNELLQKCVVIINRDIGEILSSFDKFDDLLIITTNHTFWQYFRNDRNVKPKGFEDIEQLEVKGFIGWYEVNDSAIPIFEISLRELENMVIVLNKTAMGQLIQYSPLNNEAENVFQRDKFYMDVRSFSENKHLMSEFISNPPVGLEEIGSDDQKISYLQTRVHIQILERFEIRNTERNIGYKIFVDDNKKDD